MQKAKLGYFDITSLKNNIDPPTVTPPYSVSLVLQVVLFSLLVGTETKCSINVISTSTAISEFYTRHFF